VTDADGRRGSGSPGSSRSPGHEVVDGAQLSLVRGAVDRAPGQDGRPPHAVATSDLFERLALWLADVSAEAACASSEEPDVARLEPAS
jgi:hypothetical protein